ncbi:MAG: hypothetical protein ABI600_12010 [Luteolibacter sp.]
MTNNLFKKPIHPRILEIIQTSNYCHAAMLEADSLLPEDDAELDEWIVKVVDVINREDLKPQIKQ